MTSKDYFAIAVALATARTRTAEELGEEMHASPGWARDLTHNEVEGLIANVLAADNPRFDRDRFFAACREGER